MQKLKGYAAAKQIWRHLEDYDRETFGNDLEAALREHGDIVTMWLTLARGPTSRVFPTMLETPHTKRVEFCLAVARCGYWAGFLSEASREQLIARIKEDADALKPL